ncbi:hypothetical protein BCR33DRAFT_356201 [Rhizoclosmatium globosum]|uniref:Protein kinase domain-containing protein n=1 Tax=Rhizoclosmatium globosum TaxID=329046 RepID=A0A1Y2C0X5_9FUNG|nr:hypothetical protein BCR33DRAFT_356201 [Rhizoclosmatium globosum]|eukprot:ORY40670.1 hypothetical protein BCR33DRAFT_356201 [Rhizoclosmatium globosum]
MHLNDKDQTSPEDARMRQELARKKAESKAQQLRTRLFHTTTATDKTGTTVVFDTHLSFEDLLHTVPAACGKRDTNITNPTNIIPIYPRSCETFVPWPSFAEEVYEFSESYLKDCFGLVSEITMNQMKVFQRGINAGCERDVESSLESSTFAVLVELLGLMGIGSSFFRGDGDSSVILEPDYTWKLLTHPNCNLPIEVKPFWLFPEQVDLAAQYEKDLSTSKDPPVITESVTVQALNQMYVYMSLNSCRYAALTTQHELHCFKRCGASNVQISSPIPLAGIMHLDHHLSYFECWLFMLYNARQRGITASHSDSASSNSFAEYNLQSLEPIHAPFQSLYYHLREINANQIRFTETHAFAKGAVGTVITGDFHNQPGLKFKLYDVYHDPLYVDISMKEVAMYKTLESLQGTIIPMFYGYFNYHGILVIAMEDCGVPITVEEYPFFELRVGTCVTALHALGVHHQDLEARDGLYPNILKSQCGTKIRIIDFHL